MTAEVSKERPASRLSTAPNEFSEDHLSEHNCSVGPPKLLERIVVRIEVTDTGYGIQQKEMYQTKLFSKQSVVYTSSCCIHGCGFRCLQPDGGWQAARG